MSKFKIGDKAEVIKQCNQSAFNIGEIVECSSNKSTVIGSLECFEFDNGTIKQLLDERDFKPLKQVDSIVEEVRKDLKQRSKLGIEKYNTTLDREDIDLKGWLEHQYQELLDAALYCKRAIKELESKK